MNFSVDTRLKIEEAAPENSLIVERTAPGLEATSTLFRALNQAGIRYCHWKGSQRLARNLNGLSDLDLLVDRAHGQEFRRIMLDHDVKLTLAAPGKQVPGVEHYLGFDPKSGRLYHLHVYYRLIIGEKYVPNYQLPMERQFLDSTHMLYGVKIPVPEMEIVVLTLRTILNVRDRDALWNTVSLGRIAGLPTAIQNEFKYLLEQTNFERIEYVIRTKVGFIPADPIITTIRMISESPGDVRLPYRQRARIKQALAPYARFDRWQAQILYLRALKSHNRLSSLLRHVMRIEKKRQTMASGGLSIAVTGADGAGKSTIIDHVQQWLSWRLTVDRYYLGSSQPSISTGLLKSISRMLRMVSAGCGRLLSEQNLLCRFVENCRMFAKNLSYIGVGRDRFIRFHLGQRKAKDGSLVIYERFPLAATWVNGRPADGPRIAHVNRSPLSRFAREMSRIEERYYRQITAPDHLIVLQVSPEVSHSRKPDHRLVEIEAKSRAMKNIARDDLNVTEIDADQPLEQVLRQVKTELWRLL